MADVGRWKPYVRRQGQLLPAFVEDALDASDPVFFIDDVVEGFDLTALERRYAVVGGVQRAPALCARGRPGMRSSPGRCRHGRFPASCVTRSPRQLRWPRQAGRACHERDMLTFYSEPRRSLGSDS